MTEEVRRDRAEEFERRFAEKVDVFSGCVDIRTAKSAAREVFAEMDCAGSELHDGTTGSDVCDQCGVDLAALDSGGDDASRYTSRYTSRNVSACWSECPAVAVGEDGRIGESTASEIAYAEEHGKPVRYHRAAALPPPAQAPWLPTVGEWVTGVGVNSGLPRYGRFARMDQDQPGVAVLHTPLPRLVLADTLRPAEQDGDA